MNSTNLALALAFNSHYCTSKLYSAIFMHFTDLPFTLNRAFDFYSGVFVHCTDLAITVSIYRCPSKLQSRLLCIAPTLLSPSKVIFASQNSIRFVLCIHRPCSYSFESLVRTLAQVFFFYSDLFMHSIDHALTLKWHLCAS